MNKIAFIILLLIPLSLFGMKRQVADSLADRLSFEDFMKRVREHHPLAKIADLESEKGRAALASSRGAMDPKAFSRLDQKYFSEKTYFKTLDAGLSIPTWLGIDLKAGYENNSGNYLNPENSTPEQGLFYGGVEFPVLQGLFFDSRRHAIRIARVYRDSKEEQRKIILNKLFYRAGKAYWEWFAAYNELLVYEEMLKTSLQRKEFVIQEVISGDAPAIDSLEAGIQVRNRRVAYREATMNCENARIKLNNFMWQEGIIPLAINSSVRPKEKKVVKVKELPDSLATNLDNMIESHPELKQLALQQQQLEYDRRWKREQLKPQLDLRYNFLQSATSDIEDVDNRFLNDYKWGLTFQFPLFLRKERGDLKLTSIKIKEQELKLKINGLTILQESYIASNTWKYSHTQWEEYQNINEEYNTLLGGEYRLFEEGESSLFKVNNRELSYINSRLKIIDLIKKNKVAELATWYYLGVIHQFYKP